VLSGTCRTQLGAPLEEVLESATLFRDLESMFVRGGGLIGGVYESSSSGVFNAETLQRCDGGEFNVWQVQ
jgi:Na+-translocating ferredoxin:NAD+ oxidoreductase RnfC subunit